MKNLKNLILTLLILVVSVFTVSVSAAEKGSITITNAENGRVYDIYKIFDLTYNGSKVAYTIDDEWVDFFIGEDAPGKEYIVDSNSDDLNEITYNGETKFINITNSNIVEFSNKALEYARELEADKSLTASGAELEFNNLDLGYYLVYPQGATEKNDANGSIASLDSTMKDVEVAVKATYPKLTKENPNGPTFDVGEYALFILEGTVPDTTGFDTYTYKIFDSWTDGLSLVNGSARNFKVTIGGVKREIAPEYTENGFTLSINMKDYQTDELIGSDVIVTYELLVTEDAILSENTHNEAYLKYSTNPKTSDLQETVKEREYVYSSKLTINKIDGDDKTELAGATFVLMKGTQYYSVSEDGTVSWEDTLEAATKYTTGEDGVISFDGLKDGDYKLVEIEAPIGYNKLPQPVDVHVAGKVVEKQPMPVELTKIVENKTGKELPSTGGFGTKLFITIGSLLVMASMVVLVTNKRMSKEEI